MHLTSQPGYILSNSSIKFGWFKVRAALPSKGTSNSWTWLRQLKSLSAFQAAYYIKPILYNILLSILDSNSLQHAYVGWCPHRCFYFCLNTRKQHGLGVCSYLGSVVTQVEGLWRRNEGEFVRSIVHRVIQGLSTGGHQHGRVHRGDTVMDHDVLERGRVRRERQAEGDVGRRPLNVALGKRKSRHYSKTSESSHSEMFKTKTHF